MHLIPSRRRTLLLAHPAGGPAHRGAPAPAAPEDQPIYSGAVQKIIDGKCLACHTPEKKKGEARS